MAGENDSGHTGQPGDRVTRPSIAVGGGSWFVRLRLGVDGDLELHPDTEAAAAHAAHTRLNGVPLDTVLGARWGIPHLLSTSTRLRPDATLVDTAILHRGAPADSWLCLSWERAKPVSPTEPCAATPDAITAEVLDWMTLSPEDALSAAGPSLQAGGVLGVEVTDGISLHQLLLGDAPPVLEPHALLLGTPDDPVGRMTLAIPPEEARPAVHMAAWMLTQVAQRARLRHEVRRRDQSAQRVVDLQRAVLSVVSGDAPPEAAIYAATRLLHAQAGTLITSNSGNRAAPEIYGGWITELLRQQVLARLAEDGDPRPSYAVMPADQAPVLIVPLPAQGTRRGAWVFQLSRRPWFLRPTVLDALLEAARHPVHLHGWATPPALEPAATSRSEPRSVLSLLQQLGDLEAPSAVAGQGLRYLAPSGHGAWGAYLAVKGGQEPNGSSGIVTLSSVLRIGSDLDHPRPSVLQSVVAAFWHTVGRAEGLSLSAPHPLLPAPLQRLSLAPVRTAGGERVSGVLVVGNGPEDARADAQLPTLLAVLAQQVGQAAERQLSLRQLSRAREQTFRILGRLLEYRSFETKGHTDRVTSLALKLGLQLDLTSAQLTILRWGAYLHDIGKIAIPDAVLHKDGPLSTSERGQMHEHVLIGEALLREQALVPEGVLEIVRSHHERWDGSGHPDGLRGDGIPLLARVFSVVDVYDALTSTRTYKPSWTQEQSLVELANLAGQALDPKLTRVFIEMVRRGDLSGDDGMDVLAGLSAD
ncbi:HD-GYP domain-containing protein [Deinococcus sp. KSM4-11]|uniref:HD-GYP domain-containing protein n=1 Tax=Deinococcus sp. KSM4-11 TaxID=2568654 RepID=UPI0010A32344|nr:HD-GYP domain-containing protein [Deinococcus sp. KSM4-11]THF88152.1 HD-GYP domain-containing protein [Deinococcus sp. KSM4-11]